MAVKREDIDKELEDIPEDKTALLLDVIRRFRESLREEENGNKTDAMLQMDELAVETGIKDLAENHDRYLYGLRNE